MDPEHPERALTQEDLAVYLDHVLFPADLEAMLASAREHNAPPEILEELQKLPAGTTFETREEAWEALGG